MRKRSRKAKPKGAKGQVVKFERRRDANQLAAASVRRAMELADDDSGKNPAAVALGRRGGLKGGKARAAKLTKEQLRASALKAARARWAKKNAEEPTP